MCDLSSMVALRKVDLPAMDVELTDLDLEGVAGGKGNGSLSMKLGNGNRWDVKWTDRR